MPAERKAPGRGVESLPSELYQPKPCHSLAGTQACLTATAILKS